MVTNEIFQFEITINVLVTSYIDGIDFKRENLNGGYCGKGLGAWGSG